MQGAQPQRVRRAGILGIGLDSDGETWITSGDDITLLGGSEETHRMMQEQVQFFTAQVELLGKSLEELSEQELDSVLEKFHQEFGAVES